MPDRVRAWRMAFILVRGTCICSTDYVSNKQTSQDHRKPDPLGGADNLAGAFAEKSNDFRRIWICDVLQKAAVAAEMNGLNR
jgi:hypothetical protein